MQRNSLLWMMATAVVLIVSCGRADKTAVAVPKDAALVLHINSSSLSSKLSWKEIQATNWFKDSYAQADDTLAKKLLENPEASGIDVQGDLVFFLKRQGKGGYGAFEGSLKDAAAFEAFNKKMKTSATSSKDGDLAIIKLDNEVIATYKDGRFIYVFDAPFLDMGGFMGRGSSGSASHPQDSLIAFAKSLYDLKGDNSLGDDARYTSLIKDKGDIHFWANAQGIYGGMIGGAMSMMKFSTLLEGNISAVSVNFDNGKIEASMKSYYNDELAKVFDKYKMKNLDEASLARIPSENIVGVFAMNYPPEGLKEFIKLLGVDGMVNGFLGEVGYSMDEFVKANKGDLLVSVSDFDIKNEVVTYPSYEEGGQPYTYTKSNPSVKWLFATSVNDKPAFDKLIGVVSAKIGDAARSLDSSVNYTMNDKWFTIGNNADQVNKFAAGSANIKAPFISKLTGHPMGMYVDLQKILKVTEATATDSTAKVIASESVKLWQDIVVTGGDLSGGAREGHFEINFVDKNTNSLKQLNQYADKLAALKKKAE